MLGARYGHDFSDSKYPIIIFSDSRDRRFSILEARIESLNPSKETLNKRKVKDCFSCLYCFDACQKEKEINRSSRRTQD